MMTQVIVQNQGNKLDIYRIEKKPYIGFLDFSTPVDSITDFINPLDELLGCDYLQFSNAYIFE